MKKNNYMPNNLNALLRYKTIDEKLRNSRYGVTIEELIEACSEKLGEQRGVYTGVSERTIREDLRIMKSDILDFNAPIVIEGKRYRYVDSRYSIFNIELNNNTVLSAVRDVINEYLADMGDEQVDDLIAKIHEKLNRFNDIRFMHSNWATNKVEEPKKDYLNEEDVMMCYHDVEFEQKDTLWIEILRQLDKVSKEKTEVGPDHEIVTKKVLNGRLKRFCDLAGWFRELFQSADKSKVSRYIRKHDIPVRIFKDKFDLMKLVGRKEKRMVFGKNKEFLGELAPVFGYYTYNLQHQGTANSVGFYFEEKMVEGRNGYKIIQNQIEECARELTWILSIEDVEMLNVFKYRGYGRWKD